MRVIFASAALLALAAASTPAHADGGAVEVRDAKPREREPAGRYTPRTRMRSPRAFITGCVLLPVGVAAIAAGVPISKAEHSGDAGGLALGMGDFLILTGSGMALAGLILLPVGAHHVDVPDSPAVAIALSPTAATLRGRW